MPRNSSRWVTHRINGGWATDYGRTFYGSPEGGSFEIPWCNTCENVRFNPDGSFGKYPGLDSFLGVPIKAPWGANGFAEGSYIRQLYSYVRMGTTLTGTRKEMVVIGSYLYTITSGILTQIGDLSSSSITLHQMSTFNDLLVIGGGTTGSPKSWDQTTFQSLTGTPPSFGFSTPHAGRHWAAGVGSVPYRLYYSAVGNPEDWVGAGSGSIDIDPGDGDAIVGLLSWKRELWVFKGPNRLSIHRITGSSPSDFARVPFTYGVSAAGQQSIFPVGDDFAFWSPRGSCHSLTATASYGDYTQAYVNFPILSWCRNPDNIAGGTAGYYWQTVTDSSQNITYCTLNNGFALNRASVTLAMDWRFRTDSNPYPRFTLLNFNRKITALGLLAGRIETSQLLPTFGDKDGWVLQESSPNDPSFKNDASPLSYTLETPGLTYGPSVETKTITAVSVDVVSNYNALNSSYGSLDLSYGGPKAPTQTLTFDTRNGIGLGTFVLGTDQLADGNETPGFAEDVNGDSRAFTYTFAENSGVVLGRGNDVRVKHFSVRLIPTGESLENT